MILAVFILLPVWLWLALIVIGGGLKLIDWYQNREP